jgi:SAM-dependent methyltransferase
VKASHRIRREVRKSLLYAAEPLDAAARRLNGKRGYPPVALRRQSGPLDAFERVAGEYVAYLVTLADLGPKDRILDVGCGSGAMALMLGERLSSSGRYVGFEVDQPTVDWCSRHFSEDERFHFFHFDYWNATYNPSGTRELKWPIDDSSVDAILLKSIFTHMLPPDVDFYLSEISRVLRPGGKALVTAFLFDAKAGAVVGRHSFPFSGEHFRYANRASPESAIALDIKNFQASVSRHGLIGDVLPGLWREETEPRPYAYQDMIVLRRVLVD